MITHAPTTPAAPVARYNIYALVHKGLRAAMSDCLRQLGRCDWLDAEDRDPVLAQTRELLALCAAHLKHENNFVHPAMEKARPGCTAGVAHEHVEHQQHIASMQAEMLALDAAPEARRADLGLRLYQRIALFVAENFTHMAMEETDNNAVLWAAYTDAQILDIEHALVAAIEPESHARFMKWMLPSLTPQERAGLLGGMRAHAPAPVFAATMTQLYPLLSTRDWRKLCAALELPAEQAVQFARDAETRRDLAA